MNQWRIQVDMAKADEVISNLIMEVLLRLRSRCRLVCWRLKYELLDGHREQTDGTEELVKLSIRVKWIAEKGKT